MCHHISTVVYHEDTIDCRLLLLDYKRKSILNVSCPPPRYRTHTLLINAGHRFSLHHITFIARLLPLVFLTSSISYIIFGEVSHVSEQPPETPLLKYWTPVTSVGEHYVVRSYKAQRDKVYEWK